MIKLAGRLVALFSFTFILCNTAQAVPPGGPLTAADHMNWCANDNRYYEAAREAVDIMAANAAALAAAVER